MARTEATSAVYTVVEDIGEVMTITAQDLNAYGCPYCNYACKSMLEALPAWECCENRFCRRSYIVVTDAGIRPSVSLNGRKPEVRSHPRGKIHKLKLEYRNPDQLFTREDLEAELIETRLKYEDALESLELYNELSTKFLQLSVNYNDLMRKMGELTTQVSKGIVSRRLVRNYAVALSYGWRSFLPFVSRSRVRRKILDLMDEK